ncbi:hypothetical protein Tco_0979172 [Tanacetum coccineum]
MDDDLFTYEVKIPKLSYSSSVRQQMDDLHNGNLDVYKGNYVMTSVRKCMLKRNEIKESVIATWLIRSYKKQFVDYMEIKKQKEVYGLDKDMEYDPSNIDFSEWLASKFSNHMKIDVEYLNYLISQSNDKELERESGRMNNFRERKEERILD